MLNIPLTQKRLGLMMVHLPTLFTLDTYAHTHTHTYHLSSFKSHGVYCLQPS
jgi:hypothetical protein